MAIKFIKKFREDARASEYRYMMLIAAVIGLLGGIGAVLFRKLIDFIQTLAYGNSGYSISLIESLEWWHVVLVPAAGGLLIGPIVYYFAREARGHGVPEVMEAVALKQGVIRKRIVFAKTLASAICIGSGGSVGREGPIVQIGSAIGSALGQLLHVSRSKLRTMVGCGAAAGIAATFNAPVAGVLFSLEIILGDFGVRRFTPIVISSVIATAVSHHFVGDTPAFAIDIAYEMVSPVELVSYSVLGVAAGLIGLLFAKVVYGSEDLFNKLKIPTLTKPVIGGLMIGFIGLQFPHLFGVGYETIERALNEQVTWSFLFLLVALKLIATSITLGSGGSGGVFAPSLFLGAVLGGGMGHMFHSLFPEYTASSGAYALVGMGAVVSAATRAPLTSIMIIFEMTGDYKIILPLMFACIIGNVIADRLNPNSIYTLKLTRRGVNLHRGQEVNILSSIRVGDIISPKYLTIRENDDLGTMLQQVIKHPYTYFYVTDDDGRFKGVVAVDDFRHIILETGVLYHLVIAKDVMRDNVTVIEKEDALDKVMRLFGSRNREEFPVVDKADENRIVGVVTRRALISAYNSELLKRDAVSEVVGGISTAAGKAPVSLSKDTMITEVEAPGWMTGKTLAGLDLRRKHGIQVLLINSAGEDPSAKEPLQLVPRPDYKIRLGDNLVVLGSAGALGKLRR